MSKNLPNDCRPIKLSFDVDDDEMSAIYGCAMTPSGRIVRGRSRLGYFQE